MAASGEWALVAVAVALALGACRPSRTAASASSGCAREDVLVRGACVSQEGAARYCGPAASWNGAACAVRPCSGSDVRDEVTGACLGARALRAVAERQHLTVEEDRFLGCRDGWVLRVAAGQARCEASGEAAAARDRACDRGAVWDGRACVRVVSATVDVAAWARATFGPSGASRAAFCERATVDSSTFGLLNGAAATAEADVQLSLSDNDVSLVYAKVTSPAGLSALALGRITAAVDADVELLRALGGTAEVGTVTWRIDCPVRAGTSPISVEHAAAPVTSRASDER